MSMSNEVRTTHIISTLKTKLIIPLVSMFLILTSCSAPIVDDASLGPVPPVIKKSRAVKNAKKGAVVGALFGALIGAATSNHDAQGALIGAAAGAAIGGAVGYIYGKIQDRKLASRDEAISQVAYSPEKGVYLEIHSIEFDPDAINKGSSTTASVKLYIIAPSESEKLKVEIGYGLVSSGLSELSENYLAGSTKIITAENGGGVFELDIPIVKTSEMEPDKYSLYICARTWGAQAQKKADFKII